MSIAFFAACGFWIAFSCAIFFRKSFTSPKKSSSSAVRPTPGDVFGKSQEVDFFLPDVDNNSRQSSKNKSYNNSIDEEELKEVAIDEFSVEYADTDVGEDFSTDFPPDALAEGKGDEAARGMLFDDIRQAVKAIEQLGSEDTASAAAVQQGRRAFKMLDETDLLQKMRSIKPEMSDRMEALTNGAE